jgi:hypothetical protein
MPAINFNSVSFLNWKDFFRKRLIESDFFSLTQSLTSGSTYIEIYASKKGDLQTTIEVGYLSDITLIYLNILNPNTPGHNRQQLIEHFYKNEFPSNESYGDPGLDFNEQNLEALYRQLSLGLNGKETLYYKNGKLIKSILTLTYGTHTQTSSIFTHYFTNVPFPVRLFKNLIGEKEKYDIKEVDLRLVFGGID